MPRIRKKTSKRGTTNKRSRIKHKVSESHRKAKKEGKKNPQWKSKHKKDPGIPNNFPYKEQILAEVAEERRKAAEAKEKRKEERKAAKTSTVTQDTHDEDEATFDGVTPVEGGAAAGKGSIKGKARAVTAPTEDDSDSSLVRRSSFKSLKAVLENADVVIHVLDAREPQACRTSYLEESKAIKEGARTILLLNKIDPCPREIVQQWVARLRQEHPTFLFRSATAFQASGDDYPAKAQNRKYLDALGVESLLQALDLEAQKKGDEALVVAVVGVANVGKSAVINSLMRKNLLPVYRAGSLTRAPSTTLFAQEVDFEHSSHKFCFVDTPALAWQHDETLKDEQKTTQRLRDVLLRCKGRPDHLKEPVPAATHILSRSTNTEDLMLFYNLPAFSKDDTSAFLSALARSNGLVKKGGVPNHNGAAAVLLRDWAAGKLPRYCAVPSTPVVDSTNNGAEEFAKIYELDTELLASIRTRKEFMKSTGVLRLRSHEVDGRVPVMDDWKYEDEEESDEDGEEEEEDGGDVAEDDEDDLPGDEDDEDGEEVEEDDEDELDVEDDSDSDEAPQLIDHSKLKRKRTQGKASPCAQKSKVVSFALPPKGRLAKKSKRR